MVGSFDAPYSTPILTPIAVDNLIYLYFLRNLMKLSPIFSVMVFFNCFSSNVLQYETMGCISKLTKHIVFTVRKYSNNSNGLRTY